jgi:hypothetical protein
MTCGVPGSAWWATRVFQCSGRHARPRGGESPIPAMVLLGRSKGMSVDDCLVDGRVASARIRGAV